jgi:general stress protein CsbA
MNVFIHNGWIIFVVVVVVVVGGLGLGRMEGLGK